MVAGARKDQSMPPLDSYLHYERKFAKYFGHVFTVFK